MPDLPSAHNGHGMSSFVFFASLAAIWGWLFFILSGEWEANAQYSHGWFIPLLATWIFWQRWTTRPEPRPFSAVFQTAGWIILLLLAAPSAFGILITGTYPDWRVVLWGLGFAALAVSVTLTAMAGGFPWVKHLSFAYFFTLLSIPWPTAPEKQLTQGLSLLAAQVAATILPLGGIAAVCHGTTIDVGTSVLGVDDACSGIRSFQSSIMAALFLGELFSLRWGYRIFLIFAGLTVAYSLNILRMIILSVAVANGGAGALEKVHDPAGFAILVITMGVLWLFCWLLQKLPQARQLPFAETASGVGRIARGPALACWGVLGAMVLMVGGSEGWYAWKGRGLTRAPAWTVLSAKPESGVRDEILDKRVQDMLRYDRGFQRAWHDAQGRQWHLIFTEWEPKRMSLHYAQPHLPEQCQRMIGREIVFKSELRKTQIHGVTLAYNLYKVRGQGREFYLMYVVNDDRIDGKQITIESATPTNRLQAVLAGRRNMGQRSIQLALIGESDATKAEAAMLETLPTVISPAPNRP